MQKKIKIFTHFCLWCALAKFKIHARDEWKHMQTIPKHSGASSINSK
jgi:hypothetical protein